MQDSENDRSHWTAACCCDKHRLWNCNARREPAATATTRSTNVSTKSTRSCWPSRPMRTSAVNSVYWKRCPTSRPRPSRKFNRSAIRRIHETVIRIKITTSTRQSGQCNGQRCTTNRKTRTISMTKSATPTDTLLSTIIRRTSDAMRRVVHEKIAPAAVAKRNNRRKLKYIWLARRKCWVVFIIWASNFQFKQEKLIAIAIDTTSPRVAKFPGSTQNHKVCLIPKWPWILPSFYARKYIWKAFPFVEFAVQGKNRFRTNDHRRTTATMNGTLHKRSTPIATAKCRLISKTNTKLIQLPILILN